MGKRFDSGNNFFVLAKKHPIWKGCAWWEQTFFCSLMRLFQGRMDVLIISKLFEFLYINGFTQVSSYPFAGQNLRSFVCVEGKWWEDCRPNISPSHFFRCVQKGHFVVSRCRNSNEATIGFKGASHEATGISSEAVCCCSRSRGSWSFPWNRWWVNRQNLRHFLWSLVC